MNRINMLPHGWKHKCGRQTKCGKHKWGGQMPRKLQELVEWFNGIVD